MDVMWPVDAPWSSEEGVEDAAALHETPQRYQSHSEGHIQDVGEPPLPPWAEVEDRTPQVRPHECTLHTHTEHTTHNTQTHMSVCEEAAAPFSLSLSLSLCVRVCGCVYLVGALNGHHEECAWVWEVEEEVEQTQHRPHRQQRPERQHDQQH